MSTPPPWLTEGAPVVAVFIRRGDLHHVVPTTVKRIAPKSFTVEHEKPGRFRLDDLCTTTHYGGSFEGSSHWEVWHPADRRLSQIRAQQRADHIRSEASYAVGEVDRHLNSDRATTEQMEEAVRALQALLALRAAGSWGAAQLRLATVYGRQPDGVVWHHLWSCDTYAPESAEPAAELPAFCGASVHLGTVRPPVLPEDAQRRMCPECSTIATYVDPTPEATP